MRAIADLGTITLTLLLLSACAAMPPAPLPAKEAGLTAVGFADLPGWGSDPLAEALPALLKTCERFAKRPDGRAVGPKALGGTVADWKAPCAAAAALPAGDDAAARAFFETQFVPFAAAGAEGPEGLITGYYEPDIRAARAPDAAHTAPIYRRPADLVTIDLGEFRADLDGESLAGRVVDNRLKPYFNRAEIEAGALKGQGLELYWLPDPVESFFLQIQGSGRLRLADGSIVRVGYEAKNGQGYYAIGKALVEQGDLPKDGVSAQSIAGWLRAHPDRAAEIMNLNRSYVFFRELTGDGPIGSLGVVLTPLRSAAVDPAFLPLGAPIWLDTTWPAGTGAAGQKLRRLVVAQDTGGAIKGAIRADLFWGTGEAALAGAGTMKQPGRYYLLLPKSVAARRAATS
jgi:membrane-bound lytic murein transglycosylase A